MSEYFFVLNKRTQKLLKALYLKKSLQNVCFESIRNLHFLRNYEQKSTKKHFSKSLNYRYLHVISL